ncbi:glycine dehydrogenase subunit 2 [Limnoglobus roseus]|uniref:Glycine dehydrogenase (decarboxylating) n=2 Tax=Limnoglobus roseus TaxID=2598579 RepID=A0A5C1A9S0_9BACT|nr:glycine dehydrogenase subunit 2 [Limnoglobus roseus]
MLAALGVKSREELVAQTVPAAIRLPHAPKLPAPATEADALAELKAHAGHNKVWRTYLGTGYAGTLTPEPIKRNVLENPGWYTAYTPYQAEVAQGRLEALLNFQQVVIDLTGLPTANASLLDEATAAAEAMTVIRRAVSGSTNRYFVDAGTHPQVIAVIRTRAHWMGIEVVVGEWEKLDAASVFGAHLQNPATDGEFRDLTPVIAKVHAAGGKVCVGTDPLACVLLTPPGEMGADIAVGNSQRFGVPLGFGGPHAAFIACKQELVRNLPGRIIGVSKDAAGHLAYRMSLQTREQHIRRDKATSNICTAQALLANMASFYAVYHGPDGLKRIASRVHALTQLLADLVKPVLPAKHAAFFDTLVFTPKDLMAVRKRAESESINLRYFGDGRVGVTLDETVRVQDVIDLAEVLTGRYPQPEPAELLKKQPAAVPFARTSPILQHPVFNRYHTETEFVRYVKRLENRDISLVHSMIPLGSCTMKLNAASEMAPVTWPEFASIHPFAPSSQTAGYRKMLDELGDWLAAICGFAKVSFEPNSGAQGEYAGLMAIRLYHESRGESSRDVCLIPISAHGTNPASAQMMGLRIVPVACDAKGNVDLDSLKAKLAEHGPKVSCLMLTYPSTHGVFEARVREICDAVHAAGGQVYMDGANLNAQVGLTSPGFIGADVCHMNLHKTFCIPHGGGGPGMGPIVVAKHLAPFLPADPFDTTAETAVSAAPFGSALITTISWMYVRMMGGSGLTKATEIAILNANYVATRLKPYFPTLYAGDNGRVAHECILDLRNLKGEVGVTAEDVAKRLMDYGFHAPTLSFPVVDTLMIEPTESESKAELDRFCDAMIAIHGEIQKVRSGEWPKADNPLKNAPHTAAEAIGEWSHPYSREVAVYPLPYVREAKFWPHVKRIDNVGGDRNLICTCPPMEAFT